MARVDLACLASGLRSDSFAITPRLTLRVLSAATFFGGLCQSVSAYAGRLMSFGR